MKSVEQKLTEVLKSSKETGKEVEDLPGGIGIGVQFWNIWLFFGEDRLSNQFQEFEEILKVLHVPHPDILSYGEMQEIFVDLLNEKTQLERWLKLRSFE